MEFQQLLVTCREKKGQQERWCSGSERITQLQDSTVGHVGLARVSSVTQFNSDLCDFSRQSLNFNNAPKSETPSQKSVMRKTPTVPAKLFDGWMISRERPAVTND